MAEGKSKFKEILLQFLNKSLRIELTDGRTIVGQFVCTDNHPNIVLADAREFWLDAKKYENPNPNSEEGAEKEEGRAVGLVMVAKEHIKSVAIAQNDL